MANPKKFHFIRGYEVNGVTPLAHYFEEIYGHIAGIEAIGPRGDTHYFWYSKAGHGAAYYEVSEQAQSAASTYDFFSKPKNVDIYLNGIEDIVTEVQAWIAFVSQLDIQRLSTTTLFKYFEKSWMLDAMVFSYYLMSQPYRLQPFESELRSELEKRVAKSRVDYYLPTLTASEKITLTAQEELDWACLLLSEKQKTSDTVSLENIHTEHSDLEQKIYDHYEIYKSLTLGDGNWVFNPQAELTRFIEDYSKPSSYFSERVESIKSFPEHVLIARRTLEKEFYLNDKTLDTINFLAEISHVRYALRVNGFIPLIYASLQLTKELNLRLGYPDENDCMYQTYEEIMHAKETSKAVVSATEIKQRRGDKDEYMIELENKKILYRYGSQAAERFKELVPSVNYEAHQEVSGVAAESGVVRGGVTVYHWGDDLESTLRTIKNFPILVAGQTRPAMMPIIRQAHGIITDEGGVTSHAAIIARELKIPTIINTHVATRVFKTGDRVLLDANSGIARKLQ